MTKYTYAGTIKITLEKEDNPKVFDFITRLHTMKPVEYDYVWSVENQDYRATFEKKMADFKKGKLEHNLPLVKLNRHISEVYHESVKGNFSRSPPSPSNHLCTPKKKKKNALD